MPLYRTTKRLIETGQTEGLEEKLDILFVAGKFTVEEYNDLMALLKQQNPNMEVI